MNKQKQIEEIRKGDIICNPYAGKNNPTRYLLFLGKGTIKQGRYTHKIYKCIDYDGKKVELMRDTPIVYIGHMNEFDDFLKALKKLEKYEYEQAN